MDNLSQLTVPTTPEITIELLDGNNMIVPTPEQPRTEKLETNTKKETKAIGSRYRSTPSFDPKQLEPVGKNTTTWEQPKKKRKTMAPTEEVCDYLHF